MRVLVATSLLAAALALGACSTSPAPTELASAGLSPRSGAQVQPGKLRADLCDAVQGTTNAHQRQTAALDRSLGRDLPRPVASTASSSVGEASTIRCRIAPTPIRRDGQRARRNAAVDRALSRGI